MPPSIPQDEPGPAESDSGALRAFVSADPGWKGWSRGIIAHERTRQSRDNGIPHRTRRPLARQFMLGERKIHTATNAEDTWITVAVPQAQETAALDWPANGALEDPGVPDQDDAGQSRRRRRWVGQTLAMGRRQRHGIHWV